MILKLVVSQYGNTTLVTDGSPSPLTHPSISGSAFTTPAVNSEMSTFLYVCLCVLPEAAVWAQNILTFKQYFRGNLYFTFYFKVLITCCFLRVVLACYVNF